MSYFANYRTELTVTELEGDSGVKAKVIDLCCENLEEDRAREIVVSTIRQGIENEESAD